MIRKTGLITLVVIFGFSLFVALNIETTSKPNLAQSQLAGPFDIIICNGSHDYLICKLKPALNGLRNRTPSTMRPSVKSSLSTAAIWVNLAVA